MFQKTSDSRSLQAVRVFGVTLDGLSDESARIMPENIYRLSQDVFKGSGDLQNPYGTVIKMLLLDFVAYAVTPGFTASHVRVGIDTPVAGRTSDVCTLMQLLLPPAIL